MLPMPGASAACLPGAALPCGWAPAPGAGDAAPGMLAFGRQVRDAGGINGPPARRGCAGAPRCGLPPAETFGWKPEPAPAQLSLPGGRSLSRPDIRWVQCRSPVPVSSAGLRWKVLGMDSAGYSTGRVAPLGPMAFIANAGPTPA